jgi:dienelactone hydrolase
MERVYSKWFRRTLAVFFVAAVIVAGPALAQDSYGPPAPTYLIPQSYGGGRIQIKAWLRTPPGAGPFSTVIMLHGCNGLNRAGWKHAVDWASWFNGLGLAVLIVDSFSPRYVANTCGEADILSGELQAADLYTSADYISQFPQFRGKKIGAIGFSHGGWGILDADATNLPGIQDLRARLQSKNVDVAAFVAMYPGCARHIEARFYAPLLILIGLRDQNTRAETCQSLAAFPRPPNPEVRVKIYPDATHSFDVNKPPRRFLGRLLQYDAAATTDAHSEIEAFFKHWLR